MSGPPQGTGERPGDGGIGTGLMLLPVLQILGGMLLVGFVTGGGLVLAVTVGLWQWIVVAPVAILAQVKGSHGIAKGLWIGGAAVTLLNGLCWAAAR